MDDTIMKLSENKRVEEFLEETMIFNDKQFNILQKLREIVFDIYPKTTERMMYGGIMFSIKDDFGGIFIRRHHISFEFTSGFLIKDPNRLLEGKGKARRHLKIKSILDIDNKKVEFFVRQVVKGN